MVPRSTYNRIEFTCKSELRCTYIYFYVRAIAPPIPCRIIYSPRVNFQACSLGVLHMIMIRIWWRFRCCGRTAKKSAVGSLFTKHVTRFPARWFYGVFLLLGLCLHALMPPFYLAYTYLIYFSECTYLHSRTSIMDMFLVLFGWK